MKKERSEVAEFPVTVSGCLMSESRIKEEKVKSDRRK